MSSFLSSQAQLRRGKWTAEEEVYAACIIEAYKEGSLHDVEEGLSLRGYLALKLRTNVKRISKKYEGTNYNGKRVYLPNPSLPKEVVAVRQAKLKELELNFEKSVKLMEDAESAKKDMARMNSNSAASLLSAFSSNLPSLQATSAVFPHRGAMGREAALALVSRDLMAENMRILSQQTSLNSSGRSLAGSAGLLGSALNIGRPSSFGSLSNLELQALLAGLPTPRTRMPTSISEPTLNQLLLQQAQHDRAVAAVEILARQEAARLFGGAAVSALEQRPRSPSGSSLGTKRPTQLPSYLESVSPTSNKRARFY